jgi:inhibitor of KinA
MRIDYICSGDSAITILLGNTISEEVNKSVKAMKAAIETSNILGIRDIISSYASILVCYDPTIIYYDEILLQLKALEEQVSPRDYATSKTILIPVLYGGEYGRDLSALAKLHNLSENEVIKIHTDKKYLTYMIGFTPGFPYLGEVDSKISTSRKDVPDLTIKKGSVGIAESQTGIYPLDSPGGWNIIGRTPFDIYDERRDNPFLIQAGDFVCFKQICKSEYLEIKKAVESGEYKYNL